MLTAMRRWRATGRVPLQAYQQLDETMSYAQGWDAEKGLFWKPAEEAQKRIKVLAAQGVVKKRGIEKPH